MSGIAGIIRFDGAPVEPGLIEKMTGSMPYRGPDGINHWVKGSVALGQCMLRTTPESLEEHQPLCNEDESLVLVMDGRVDNWEELRRELLGRGAVLRTRADAELVLRAYEAWGRDCLPHIDGDFALVIWDARRREAFCARDRIGKKTFTYHWDGKTFAFASELHAILALPWLREELNEGILAEFLANEWYSRDETFWKGILRLVAAHQMTVGVAGPQIEQYWMPDLWSTLPYTRDEEYVEHYRDLFTDVVRRMSRSHLPVAYEVSGGLDSSAIFAMAEHLRRDGKLPAPALEGYSLKFENAPDAEERQYSRAVGEHLGVPIHECDATMQPLDWYRDWARHYREFPGYPNGIMAVGLRQTARQYGCRALLAGIGGDEWLGMPYTPAYFTEELGAQRWTDLLSTFASDRQTLGTRQVLWWILRCVALPLLPEVVKSPLRMLRRARQPSRISARLEAFVRERRNRPTEPNAPRLRRRGQAFQLMTLRGAYSVLAREFEERLGSSLGLELRLPLFSQRIVQFAFSTPERLRSRGHKTKLLHRLALRGLLPNLVLERLDKADFMVTFHRNLVALAAELRDRILRRRSSWIGRWPPGALPNGSFHFTSDGQAEWWLWTLVGCDALLSLSS
jgi:asparagine synthase (glutamine-hydrolysing)